MFYRNLFSSFTEYTLSQNTRLQFRGKMLLIWLLLADILTRDSSSFMQKPRRYNTTYMNSKTNNAVTRYSAQPFQKHFEHLHLVLYFIYLFMSTTIRNFPFCFKPTWERSFPLKIHEARNSLLHLSEKCWEQQDKTQAKGHSTHALLYHRNGRWYLQLEEQRGSLEG